MIGNCLQGIMQECILLAIKARRVFKCLSENNTIIHVSWELFRPDNKQFSILVGSICIFIFRLPISVSAQSGGVWSMILHQIVPWAFLSMLRLGHLVLLFLLFILWIFRDWYEIVAYRLGERNMENELKYSNSVNDIRK